MNKNRVTPTEVGVVGVCTDFSCNNCKKKSNKRLLKIFAAGGLAFFMGVGTLCGVVLAPMGATSASNAGDLAALAQSAARALSPQEQLLAGTLEFDSENDPVIYTTDYGLDIRWHLTGYKEDPSTLDKIPSGKFSGYAYIEAAGVKWAIIGYSSTITNRLQSGKINLANILATYSSFSGYTIESIWSLLQKQEVDSTDAGAEIYDVYKTVDSDVYNSSAVSATYIDPSALFPNAIEIELTEDSELQADEVLCFAQGRIDGTSGVAFKTGNGNFVQTEYANYQGSILEEYLETWYNTNLKSTLSPYIIS
ncbi:MAG: hypothetical protein IJ975_04360, partial [Clostridia bacterium]|nr:hypothetical protein [Clostridia bacterium]